MKNAHTPPALKEHMATSLPSVATVLETEIDAGYVMRIVTMREVTTTSEDALRTPSLPELKAAYWVALNLTNPVILNLVFTTPFTPLRDGLLDLFDSIVESLHLSTIVVNS